MNSLAVDLLLAFGAGVVLWVALLFGAVVVERILRALKH